MTDAPNPSSEASPARQVIEAFGGIRPMAHKLGLAVSTVQGWKERDSIPAVRHPDIRTAAHEAGVELDDETLARSARHDEEALEDKSESAAEDEAEEAPEAEAAMEAAEGEVGRPGEESEEERAGEPPEQAGEQPAEEAAEPPAPAPAERPAGGRFVVGLVAGAVLFAIGIGAAVGTRDLWLPLFGDGGAAWDEARVAALEGQVAGFEGALAEDIGRQTEALRAQLAGLSAKVDDLSAAGAAGGDAAALEELNSRVDGLEDLRTELRKMAAGLEALGSALAAGDSVTEEQLAAISGGQADLSERLAAAEAALEQVDGLRAQLDALTAEAAARAERPNGDLSVRIALIELGGKLRGTASFAAELAKVRDEAADQDELLAALSPLDPYAEGGLPGLADLQLSFRPAAADAVASGRAEDAGEGWVSGMVRRVSNLVTVRRVGLVEGDSAEAVVARAEQALESGDLAAATSELTGLTGGAAEAMADWQKGAEARLAGDRVVALAEGLAVTLAAEQ